MSNPQYSPGAATQLQKSVTVGLCTGTYVADRRGGYGNKLNNLQLSKSPKQIRSIIFPVKLMSRNEINEDIF